MTEKDTVLMVCKHIRNDFAGRRRGAEYRLFKQVCARIHEFNEQAGAYAPYASESVLNGRHSYTMATDGNGQTARWQDVFKKDLNPFRRMGAAARD